MSAFREAAKQLIESTLICPRCRAANRPGATLIELEDDATRASCVVCACYGPLVMFQPKETPK